MPVGRQSLKNAEKIKRPDGYVYLFPLHGGLPDMEIFADIIDLYESKQAGVMVPRRSVFDFKDLRGWHANVCLLKFDDDLADGTFRLLGETYHGLYGGALKAGMKVSDSAHANLPGLLEYFKGLLETPAIGSFSGTLPADERQHIKVDTIDFPLLNSAGLPRYMLSFIRETMIVRGYETTGFD